jgi:hypothetical protein
MKIFKKIALLNIILLAGIMVLSGCHKNPAGPKKPKKAEVYMPQALHNPVKITLTNDSPKDTAKYSASVGGDEAANNNITVHFDVDSSLIDTYNSNHSTSLLLLPQSNYKLSKVEEMIHAGDKDGAPLKVIISGSQPTLQKGQNYLLPITVSTSEGGMDVNEKLQTTYFVIQNDIKPTEVYMPQAQDNPVLINLTFDSPKDTAKYNASIEGSSVARSDITVHFNINSSLVDTYNSVHSTSLLLLPQDNYELSKKKEIIRAGDKDGAPLKLIISGKKPTLKNGQNYLLPITVSTNVDSIKVSKKLQTTYFVVKNNIVSAEKPAGQGVNANPYKITNLGNLKWVSKHSSSWGASYVQTQDINALQTQGWKNGKGFVPIGNSDSSFTGTYNGQGHTIKGLFIQRPSQKGIGFFGNTGKKAVIKNIHLTEVDITGGVGTGGIVGINYGKIEDVEVSSSQGQIKGGKATIGGLVGSNHGIVKGSQTNINVISSGQWVGGLVGSSAKGAEIVDSHSTGNVQGSGINVGGLVGINKGLINNSYATGDVQQGKTNGGGLVGKSSGGKIKNSYATGDVTGDGDEGGLIGRSTNTSIISCHATGNVKGTKSTNGGLIGYFEGGSGPLIKNSYATGDVRSVNGSNAGGLVGFLAGNANIEGSFATGDARADGSHVAGLIGDAHFSGSIINSYAMGNAKTGKADVGGLIGYISGGTIENSYSTGKSNGSESIGGLIGKKSSSVTIKHSYWDIETSELSSSAGGTGLKTKQMQGATAKTKMDGYDFKDVWQVQAGSYPTLRNNQRGNQ